MTDTIAEQMLAQNREWAAGRVAENANYFIELAKEQHPHTLWIGCADSRVPENLVTGTQSGELFVHRNIANVVVHTDLNLLSVLQYAVEVLQVQHVIVCGHYGCGGVRAALGHQNLGIINKWLRFIKDEYSLHQNELSTIDDPGELERRMVEVNVLESVRSLAKTSIIQNAWGRGSFPLLHGWVYDLETGFLRDLGIDMNSTDGLEDIYKFDPSR